MQTSHHAAWADQPACRSANQATPAARTTTRSTVAVTAHGLDLPQAPATLLADVAATAARLVAAV